MKRMNPILIGVVVVLGAAAMLYFALREKPADPEPPKPPPTAAGPVETDMRKVAPVVGAVSKPTANMLLSTSRTIDEATARQNALAEEVMDEGGETEKPAP